MRRTFYSLIWDWFVDALLHALNEQNPLSIPLYGIHIKLRLYDRLAQAEMAILSIPLYGIMLTEEAVMKAVV